MIFNSRWMALAPLFSTLVTGLPLEAAPKPHDVIPRAPKSYAVVNVDGGSSTASAPQPKTTVKETTKTIQIVNPEPTPTTTKSSPAPAVTSSSASSSTPALSPSKAPVVTETATPSVVTVIITETPASTEYYDDGKWRTYYEVKTFGAEAVASPSSTLTAESSSFTTLPILKTSSIQSYNQTRPRRNA